MRILIVEDHAEHREYVVGVFRALGFRTIAASRAAEAVGLARSERPDVILMDVMLPEGDGREAASRLKADRATARIPIIAVTGLASAEDRERCLAAGYDGYLAKPFTPQQLRDVVLSFLDRSAVSA